MYKNNERELIVNDNETTLEAILVNQNQKADETINALETLITQNENNNTESILEANLIIQNNILETLKSIKEKENEPIEIKFEIVGGEAELVEEDTEEDNETTDEEND